MLHLRSHSPFFVHRQCTSVACDFVLEEFDADKLKGYGISTNHLSNRAVPKRQLEFVAGRVCAQQALSQLGVSGKVLVGDTRRPVWPTNTVGSITHTHGFAAAAVAHQHHLLSLGIDSEKIICIETAENVKKTILHPQEIAVANDKTAAEFVTFLTIVFSAKESLFKALHPLVNVFFGFEDAVIQLQEDQQFCFQLQKTLSPKYRKEYQGTGNFCIVDGLVHTSIAIEA